jgi:6-phosphogluconolactonase
VPPDHPESNFGLAQRSLFAHINIPPENLHRMQGELQPADAAVAYREELARHFGSAGMPTFDLVLLGVGEDGHTASLAPDSEALGASDELTVANYLPKLESWRLTMTFPLINAARRVVFLVQGSEKAKVVKEIIEDPLTRLPAVAVRPASGQLDWFLDHDAAALLSRKSLGD